MRALLAGEAFQLTPELLGLLGELSLASSPTPATLVREPTPQLALPLVLLLLASRQLLEPLQRLVHLLVDPGLPLTPNRLVLVLQLVELQIEEIGEVLRGHLSATAAESSTERHLDLAESRLGSLEILERPLLRTESLLRPTREQLLLGSRHLVDRGLQRVPRPLELFAGIEDPASQYPPVQARDLVTQPPLQQREGRHVLGALGRVERRHVAHEPEGRGDDLSLLMRKRGAGASSSSPAAHLPGLPIDLAERPDLHDEDIRRRGQRPRAAVVARAREVGDEVARLELLFLQEERVPDAQETLGPGARVQRELLVGSAVDRVDEIDAGDSEVVFRLDLREHLLDRADAGVATGLEEAHRRGLIGQDLDPVVG